MTALLALDFDGVLHPKRAGGPYFLDGPCMLLAEVLDAIGDVEIVISSTWKDAYSLAQLRSKLPQPLSQRAVGTTPSLPHSEPQRQSEIVAFFAQHPGRWASWTALDDDASLFTPNCSQLVTCEAAVGFSANQAAELWQKLTSLK
jgi:hypothetical protein